MNKRNRIFLLSAIVLGGVLIVCGNFYYSGIQNQGIKKSVACTQEAKQCSDGSYVGRTGPNCEFSACPLASTDTANWKTYDNADLGFSLKYPEGWQFSTAGLHASIPRVMLGNPLEGKAVYSFQISIENNTSSLSAADYVKKILNDAQAEDVANAKNGPAPQIAPRFDKQYQLLISSYDGYELYNVFEFDHNAERIYVTNGDEVLVFDFPVADENLNLQSPTANNAISHQILGTLQLKKPLGAFCGGIAGFQCSAGYSCKLDGTFPDAGGHCIKN